ncbi:Retrovirus-related Pol polyprotein from transposon 17.6 [Araneus ventricosus]|uniref:RNA-directed DNA polymerase n=1 Tax=Araneus ventricosus TaxID=182803 RepID=A0A4Y2VUR3_ARAVE|nr:Retrovirus-related Pol polyprotein from transposon 17.6 [Araneus ventricosus]
MPFGLKNAPFYFSKMMSEILDGGDEYAVPYLDDIAIFSRTWDENLQHLQDVLERIKRVKLTIKPSKCKFVQDEVQYLGHIAGHGKRSPAELKVKAIQNFPIPTTKTEMRAFLGLEGYYRQHIPMISIVTTLLTDLLKGRNKKGNNEWNEECTKTVELLKNNLTSKPILHAPDFTKHFILQLMSQIWGMGSY